MRGRVIWGTIAFLGFFGAATAGFAKDCVQSVDDSVTYVADGSHLTGERIVDFITVIGERDLYNSKGDRLSGFKSILQQDRANYHKTKVTDGFDDVSDGAETYFTTLEHRFVLTNARYFYDCFMDTDDIAWLHSQAKSGNGFIVWVVLFRLGNGDLAVYSSAVG